MSYPDKYTRQYDYSSYQNANPTRPLPADKVNADLNQVAITSSQTVEFLKGIARADGKLKNGAVGYDQLSAALQLTFDPTDGEALAAAVADAEASASASAASAASAAVSKTVAEAAASAADASESAAAISATAAALSASALGNQVRQYDTRAQAEAAALAGDIPYGPTGVQAIKITRYADGYPLAYATYIPGTDAGPVAFPDNNDDYWELDVSGGVVTPFWFGAAGDGTTDDTAALQEALTAAKGKCLDLRGGDWGVSAA